MHLHSIYVKFDCKLYPMSYWSNFCTLASVITVFFKSSLKKILFLLFLNRKFRQLSFKNVFLPLNGVKIN